MQTEVQNYYSNIPDSSKAQLNKLRKIISGLMPGSNEVMNYGIPTFQVNDKSIVGIGGWKNFVSLYPYGSAQINKFQEELKNYKTSKGAIQFRLDEALPENLIKKIVDDRIKSMQIK